MMLTSAATTRVLESHPLVFLNACRSEIKKPGDPAWLAYTVYGDPAARVGP